MKLGHSALAQRLERALPTMQKNSKLQEMIARNTSNRGARGRKTSKLALSVNEEKLGDFIAAGFTLPPQLAAILSHLADHPGTLLADLDSALATAPAKEGGRWYWNSMGRDYQQSPVVVAMHYMAAEKFKSLIATAAPSAAAGKPTSK